MPTNPNSTITPNARLGAALADALEGQLPADECQQIATIPERYVEHALADDWASLAQLYHPDPSMTRPITSGSAWPIRSDGSMN
jgi:hypothetical protein